MLSETFLMVVVQVLPVLVGVMLLGYPGFLM